MFLTRILNLAVTVAAFQFAYAVVGVPVSFAAAAESNSPVGQPTASAATGGTGVAAKDNAVAKPDTRNLALSAPFVIRTADGLPIEVEFVSCLKDEARFRNTASGRIMPMALSRLDKTTRKVVEGEMLKVQQSIHRLPGFGFSLENNGSATARDYSVRSDLILEVRGGSRSASSSSDSKGAGLRHVPGFGYCVRFKVNPPSNLPVELPVDLKIIWGRTDGVAPSSSSSKSGARSSSSGSSTSRTTPTTTTSSGRNSGNVETVRLILGNTPGEYLSNPISKPTSSLRGVALIVINPANNAILWTGGDSALSREHLAALTANPSPAAAK